MHGLVGAAAHRGRFAPSPTGDLHLGGARTALAAWLAARAAGASFVLRVEDLDPPRTVAGAERRILDDLRALGLDWDEGPDVGGPHAPYRQSERGARYDEALARLARDGRVYPCYCSRAEIARAAAAAPAPPDAHPDEDGPRYPGTCRHLTKDQVVAHERAGRRPALRFRVEPEVIAWDDGVLGPSSGDAAAVGDFVLRRADGLPAYQLAVVVDDGAMAIGEVVRGADLTGSTARQIALGRALGQPTPRFAHVPLVLGPDGARLGKRHGAIAVRALLASHPPERIVGRLAATLGLCAPDEELRPGALAASLRGRFDLARLPRTPTRLDLQAIAAVPSDPRP